MSSTHKNSRRSSSLTSEQLQQSSRHGKRRHTKHQITYYELLELERQKNEANTVKVRIKQNFPIAPDGFIPNSVIRKFFALLEAPPKPTEKTIWKLKWKPPVNETLHEEEEKNLEADRNSPEFAGETLYFDWSEDENEEKPENEANNNDDLLTAPVLFDDASILADLVNRLRAESWFKFSNEVTVENVTKYLVNKLEERNVAFHADVCKYLKEINSKFKLTQDILDDISEPLSEELSATEPKILLCNVNLIADLGHETHAIDCGLFDRLNDKNVSNDVKSEINDIIIELTEINQHQVELISANLKRLQNPKLKKVKNFKLKKFAHDLEAEIADANKHNDSGDLDNHIIKALLKEDWVPANIRDTLKTLKDILEYLIKTLKSVKSKIFYEKAAGYLNSLYQEFKLAKSDWENKIVEHFVTNNAETKMHESLRLIDIENLERYYNSFRDDSKLKEVILLELVRSACTEQARPQVMNAARSLLRKFKMLDDTFLNDLAKWYQKKFSNSVEKPTSYSHLISQFKTRSNSIDLQEPVLSHTAGGTTVDFGQHDGAGEHTAREEEKKEKPGKSKAAAGTKTKGKTTTTTTTTSTSKETQKQQPASRTTAEKPIQMSNREPVQSKQVSRDTVNKQPSTTAGTMGTTNRVDNLSNKTTTTPTGKDRSGTLLPNKQETWDYYHERNEREANNENEKRSLQIQKEYSEIIGIADVDEDADLLEKRKRSGSRGAGGDDVSFLNESVTYIDLDKIDDMGGKDSKAILKRVVFKEYNDKMNQVSNRSKALDNAKNLSSLFKMDGLLDSLKNIEKCHLIDDSSMMFSSDSKNIRFANLKQNHRLREIEYNKLLECLIIRGLELHKHYEKLIPKASLYKADEQFVPFPYFSDFLVVHPYNVKPAAVAEPLSLLNKRTQQILAEEKPPTKPPQPTPTGSHQFNFDALNRTCTYGYPIRRPIKTNTWRGLYTDENRINDYELNHLFLINKLLISYGAQNARHFYSTINTQFRSYISKLHARIPHRIIPLIWNDPVMQKLAYIVSNSPGQLKPKTIGLKPQPQPEPADAEGPGLLFDFNANSTENFADKSLAGFNRRNNPLQFGYYSTSKDPYSSWPIFRQNDTPRNKMVKKKLYSHIMNIKHECMKLQWRYMTQAESTQQTSKEEKAKRKYYLPPLSLKATLNQPPDGGPTSERSALKMEKI